MATVRVYKANGPRELPDLHIEATEKIPATSVAADESLETFCRKMFGDEAKKIVDAMYASLPGGTLDAVFGELCQRNASIFHVLHGR